MDDKNLTSLYQKLSKNDRLIFNFNLKLLNWREYLVIWGLGVRKYLMKDGLKDTNEAKNKQFRYGVLNLLAAIAYFGVILFIFKGMFSLLF